MDEHEMKCHPKCESPDQWYERERAAFIAWWESEGQKKFGETPTLAAGAGWLARAEAVRSETACSETSPHGLWVVWYEDPAKEHEVFFGDGSEAAARARYKSAYDNWSCHLLRRVPHGK